MTNFEFTLCQILQEKNKVQNQNDSQQYVDTVHFLCILSMDSLFTMMPGYLWIK